jgi:N-acetylneuraminic acid mutarotase
MPYSPPPNVFGKVRFSIVLSLSLFLSYVLILPQTTSAADAWSSTGSLSSIRLNFTATLLQDGKVLAAGGIDGRREWASAEIYDSATGTWSGTGSLAIEHAAHTATLLNNGKVLVAGGNWYDARAEIYDPATGTWNPAGSLATVRNAHTATLLNDGRVLVVGGCYISSIISSAEIYDPATNTWSAAGSLATARQFHTATLLNDGKVLVVGGCTDYDYYLTLASAEIYDPATNTWSAASPLATDRAFHTATMLRNGKVLVVGGEENRVLDLSSAELFDPATGTWSAVGSLTEARHIHTATMLPNGQVLVAGGVVGGNSSVRCPASAELYDPSTGTWSATGALSTGRYWHLATLLNNGKVLVAGGCDGVYYLNSAELYNANLPIANAGPDQTVQAGAQVQLDGFNSTPASDITSYQWVQTSGPAVILSDPTIVRPTFSAPQVGIGGASLVFQLTVTNSSGQSSQATCTVTVTWLNQPPSANAGTGQAVKARDAVTLDGSKSTDPDDGIASYSWTQMGGPTVQLSDPGTVNPFFTAPVVSTGGASLTFKLTVTDNHGLIATDSCIVNVTWVNQPPLANAGSDQTVNGGTLVTLNGSSSTDPDDGIASFLWAQSFGTPVILSDPKAVQPTFTAPHVKFGGEVLTFQLTVTDKGGLQSLAKCAVNVQWVNTPPEVTVGNNLMILSTDQNATVLKGSTSDVDGDTLTYRWLEGTTLLASGQVGVEGIAPLDLGMIPRLPLGGHTLTLEVSDGYALCTDELILTIENSAPTAGPSGAGRYQVGTPVSLGGWISDYDGDLVTYQWLIDGIEVPNSNGQVQTVAEGTPVNLPQFFLSDLKIGTYILTLQAKDVVNNPMVGTITVDIIDTIAPTLAPVADKTILWPPNKQMVPVTIKANALDNSGVPVALKVTVACNESLGGAVYWTQPVIDQNEGTISLQFQADRLGKGDGRQYTVTITATDASGNASTANVKILVPHDQGKN